MNRFLIVVTMVAGVVFALPARAQDDAVLAKLQEMQAQIRHMQREMDALKAELAARRGDAAAAPSKSPAMKKEKKAWQAMRSEVARNADAAEEARKTVPEMKAAPVTSTTGEPVRITMDPGPYFETADKAYSFRVGGFAQTDVGIFSDDVRDQPDGTSMRRARLYATGTIDHDFNYKIDYDFANSGTTSPVIPAGLNDTYLQYTGFKPVILTVGHFREPFGLETLTSDTWTMFMERALPFMFSPDRNIGMTVGTSGKAHAHGAWTATLGGFGSRNNAYSSDDEARDATARFTYAPVAGAEQVLHVGIAASRRIPDAADDQFRFQTRFENRFSTAQAIDTFAITQVEHVDLVGLEFAGVEGPFSLQGEYVRAMVNRAGGLSDESFDSYYGEVTYALTGESKNYKVTEARFDRILPRHKLSPGTGGWGAWQVAARWSEADLNGQVIRGGLLKDFTLGLRWIPHKHLLFMANYVHAYTDRYAPTPNDDPELFMLRAQFDF